MAHEIAAWNWKEHGHKSFLIMLEENNGDTIKNIASKVDHVPYHRPDMEFNKAGLRATAEKMNEHIHLWKSNINQSVRFDFDRIVDAIRYHAVVNGISHVFFDNITAATQHLTPSEINTEVGRIAMTLAGLADELDLQIFIFSHLNTPSSGPSHEEGGQVREYQFTGSRALMRWCQMILGFERNKEAEGDDKHLSHIRQMKNRKYGGGGVIDTIYDPNTNGIIQRPDLPDGEY
jgi:twinkle protein